MESLESGDWCPGVSQCQCRCGDNQFPPVSSEAAGLVHDGGR